jgi:hypothetical protein
MREEQPKRDDHHKRAATTSNTKIQMISPKDNYFSKCKIRKWKTTFFFNKKLPLEDIKFRFQRCKIRCKAMGLDQFERFLIVIKSSIYLNITRVYICSIMLLKCTMKSEQ